MPRRSSKKDSPAKLAGRMKRRWRVVLLRSKGEILGTVEAPDVASAKAAAAVQFDLDEIQRNRIMVQDSPERRTVQRTALRRASTGSAGASRAERGQGELQVARIWSDQKPAGGGASRGFVFIGFA